MLREIATCVDTLVLNTIKAAETEVESQAVDEDESAKSGTMLGAKTLLRKPMRDLICRVERDWSEF